MLNENLARIRTSHGLTQEALAAKLHVVRQTVSKWENGTAVPDADTLCNIAEALDVSVTELLGSPSETDALNNVAVARVLAEINEQLAIRNRRSSRIWKIIAWVLGVLLASAIVTTVLSALYTASPKPADISDPIEVDVVEID